MHGFDYGEHVKDALCVRASRLLDGPALSCVPENIPEVVGSTAKEHLASGREKKQADFAQDYRQRKVELQRWT